MSALELSVVVAYALLLLVLSVYGSHRYAMAYLYYRHKYRLPTPKGRFDELPRVTIQLPIFNEMYVTERLIDAVAKIDYPRDLLEIQVLDDSTDETQGIARACVERLRARGARHRLRPPHEPQGLQGGRARERPRARAGRARRGLRRRLHPRAGLPPPHRPLLHRPRRRDGPGALGPPEPRLLGPDAGAGDPARRPLRHRAHRAQPLRPLLQLQRHRRHLAARRRSRTAAAGSTTRSPRTSTSPTARR